MGHGFVARGERGGEGRAVPRKRGGEGFLNMGALPRMLSGTQTGLSVTNLVTCVHNYWLCLQTTD